MVTDLEVSLLMEGLTRTSALSIGVAACLTAWLSWSGFVLAPGLHDNDWPLLMWLATHATWDDWSPLAIGHYGFLQLVLVRLLWPLFGSTLVAAKVLAVVATVATGACLVRLAIHLSGHASSGLTAILLYASFAETLLTGQTEFADPLALALWTGGLCAAWPGLRAKPAWLLAGTLLGLAAACRIHFTAFGFITATLLALSGVRDGTASRRDVAHLISGMAIGLAPSVLLFLRVHGTPFSPVAHTFPGQAVLGYNELDLPSTYDLHPFRELLRDHFPAVAEFAWRRIAGFPPWFWAPLAIAALLASSRRVTLRGRPLLVLALGLIYYAAFATLSWEVTPRLLLPVAALLSLGTAASLHLCLAPFRAHLVGCILATCSLWYNLPRVHEGLVESNRMWDRSIELTLDLRARGLVSAKEAFVADWNRFLVDDPELVTFYNFGFWNLLHPGFRAERPNPFHLVEDPERFAAFLRSHGVRFVILPRHHRRLTALSALARGERSTPGMTPVRELPEDTVFLLAP